MGQYLRFLIMSGWGTLPNDVRTHFMTSEAKEKVMLSQYFLNYG